MIIQFSLKENINELDMDNAFIPYNKIKKKHENNKVVQDNQWPEFFGLTLEECYYRKYLDFSRNKETSNSKIYTDCFYEGINIDFKCSENYINISLTKDVHWNLTKKDIFKIIPCYSYTNEEFILLGILSSRNFLSGEIKTEKTRKTNGYYYYLLRSKQIQEHRLDKNSPGLIEI